MFSNIYLKPDVIKKFSMFCRILSRRIMSTQLNFTSESEDLLNRFGWIITALRLYKISRLWITFRASLSVSYLVFTDGHE